MLGAWARLWTALLGRAFLQGHLDVLLAAVSLHRQGDGVARALRVLDVAAQVAAGGHLPPIDRHDDVAAYPDRHPFQGDNSLTSPDASGGSSRSRLLDEQAGLVGRDAQLL